MEDLKSKIEECKNLKELRALLGECKGNSKMQQLGILIDCTCHTSSDSQFSVMKNTALGLAK